MDLQPGMSIVKANSQFWVYCNKGDQNGQHLLPQGIYEYDSSIRIYRGNPSTKRHKGDYEQCEKTLYFKDGVLVSDQTIRELDAKGEQEKKALRERIREKRQLMFEYISSNELQVLDKFKGVEESDFKIYSNAANQYFYSKNYEFVDPNSVAIEIARHEREEVDRKERELFEKNRALQLQAQNEKLRIEKELIERNKKEQEQKERQLQDRVNKLIAEYNLVVVYRDGTFLVSKNNADQFFYIKDGAIRKPDELKEEIAAFNLHQKRRIEFERQASEIRNKNLAYRWVVQAQAVCSSGSTCRITGIREEQRLADGSASFVISHQTWRGSGGSSGNSTIICGFGKQNTLRSTSVNAVCQ